MGHPDSGQSSVRNEGRFNERVCYEQGERVAGKDEVHAGSVVRLGSLC